MARTQSAGVLERFGTVLFGIRQWVDNGWRMALLLGKGAYLLGERKRMFLRLGEEAYRKVRSGEINDAELKPLVDQLERMTRKVKIEEMLIQRLRFGGKIRGRSPKKRYTGPRRRRSDRGPEKGGVESGT